MWKLKHVLLCVLTISLGTGCATTGSSPGTTTGDTGSLVVQAKWPANLPSELVTVKITASGPGMEPKSAYVQFSNAPGIMYGIDGVPAGSKRTVVLEGLTSDYTKLFQSAVGNITVIPSQITNCGLFIMNPISTTIPPVPQQIKAMTGNEKVTIAWENVFGAASYNIYMNKAAGASKKNFDARKVASSNSYSWTDLDNGKTYHFVITAENAIGESAASSEVMATPAGTGETVTPPEKEIEKPVKKAAPVKKKPAPREKKVTPPPEKKAKPPEKKVPPPPEKTVPPPPEEKVKPPEKTVAPPPKEKAKPPEEKVAAPASQTAAPEKEPEPKAETPEKIVAPAKPPTVASLNLQEILLKVDETRAPAKTFVFDMKITSISGDKKSISVLHTRVKDFSKSLVVYRKPSSQKGRVLLMVESNMWIFSPGTRRPIKISPQQQLLGQVSNADVARVVYSLDYKAESMEDDTIEGTQFIKMFLKAKTKGAAYGSITIWVKKSGYKIHKADFFSISGRLLKTIYYKGYKTILGTERPTIHEVHDAIKKSEMTIMEYSNMKIDDTPDRYFQKSIMERVPQIYQ